MDVVDESVSTKNPSGKVSARITIFLLQIFNFLIYIFFCSLLALVKGKSLQVCTKIYFKHSRKIQTGPD